MVASKGRRLGAFLIDSVLLSIATGLLAVVLFVLAYGADSDEASVAIFLIGGLLVLVLVFAYKFILELTPWRATFGKKILGIRIVAADGSEAGAGAIIGRELLYVVFSSISIVNLIFYIMLAVDDDARGWHDHLASTKVVMG
ncbi:MAG: RDD family protein [Chloroflexi bacterium]|nr:RDD family protein [Chloroflexota bacterium]MDE2702226.1 RDD family protein [Chloroflexota bacterium]MDE2862432.1 RDD family protein [Chloroflexota bacterium]MDE2935705.1 RDD family protein [Chloroflexota bacterium]MXW27377.1 RDD family protein [Chloroflexota bacterium]